MKKITRKYFLKSIFNFGILSFLPFKLNAFNFLDENCETTSDIQGPFYIENPPNISILTPPEINSNFLFITGTVYANDCKTPIPNAVVDIWHANKGTYNEITNTYLDSGYEDDFYRGKIFTDENGNYAFQTILPGKYLNGQTYRPSHIHLKSSYLNQNEITTQIYFEGDSSIETDPWASNPSAENRIVQVLEDEENNFHTTFDIYLNVKANEIEESNLNEKNIFKSIFPNPVNEVSVIYLNNFNKSISIDICDVKGKIINQKKVKSNSILLREITNKKLPKGIYILRILDDNTPIESKRFIVN